MTRDDHDRDAHDRTHRLAKMLGVSEESVAGLSGGRVVLELGPDAAATDVGKLAFLTLCNLVTRLGPYVPNLEVSVPEGVSPLVSGVYPRAQSVADQALWVLREAIPLENLVRAVAKPSGNYRIAISVGAPALDAAIRMHVGWDGWLGIVSDHDPLPAGDDSNPLGAITAAAMATSRLHALQLASIGAQIPDPAGTWRLNALTLGDAAGGRPLGYGVSLPRILLVGAGALGSSFAYAMAHVPGLRAEVDAVDSDVLKPSNANRQITAVFERTRDERTHKVDDLAAAWPAVRPIPLLYDRFKAEHRRSASDYEIAVTAVDNAEARRAVASDLPRVVIDGATGGLMLAVMRASDPATSCLACAYAEIVTDEDGIWARRLGTSRECVQQLRTGALSFTDDVIRDVRERGTFPLDDRDEEALRRDGWKYLVSARCGDARPDRDLPSASVSCVSALCGFLMATQVLGEALGVRTLDGASPRWSWANVLTDPRREGERMEGGTSRKCSAGHSRRSRIYRGMWP